MQKKVVDWLYNLQSRWGILKEEERSLYEYAYRLLLSRILRCGHWRIYNRLSDVPFRN